MGIRLLRLLKYKYYPKKLRHENIKTTLLYAKVEKRTGKCKSPLDKICENVRILVENQVRILIEKNR